MELRDQVIEVARLRQNVAVAADIVRKLREAWDIEHQGELVLLKGTQDDLAQAEAILRDAAVIAFKETGNKAPVPGVGIRDKTILDYLPSEALTWAKEHGLALALNTKEFETIAKSGQVPFVKIHTEPQATIATDLAKVLEKEAT